MKTRLSEQKRAARRAANDIDNIDDLLKLHNAKVWFDDGEGLVGVYNHRGSVMWYRYTPAGYSLVGETDTPEGAKMHRAAARPPLFDPRDEPTYCEDCGAMLPVGVDPIDKGWTVGRKDGEFICEECNANEGEARFSTRNVKRIAKRILADGLGGTCPTCGADNDIVNQCGCDPDNMPVNRESICMRCGDSGFFSGSTCPGCLKDEQHQ